MMKKCCVLLAMLLLLTGCGKQAPIDRPHTLEINYGESSVFAKTNGYSWNWKEGRETVSVTADSEDPRALLGKLPYLNAGDQTQLVLDFAETPQEVEVLRWSSADNYAAAEPVELADLTMEVPQTENSYLYSISALWNEGGKNWGECTYQFLLLPRGVMASQGGADVDFTEVAGDLTLPEVLELEASDLFGVEVKLHQGQGAVKTCRSQKDKTAVLDFLKNNLSEEFQPVQAAPMAEYILRLACVDGRQVTVSYGASGGSAWIFVGDEAYEVQDMPFDSLWEQLGVSAVSPEVSQELSEDQWGDDFVYAYVKELGDTVVYDDVRWIDDPEAPSGFRLENGWKDQQKPLAEDCQFWMNKDAETYDRLSKEGLLARIRMTSYIPLFRLYQKDGVVVAVVQYLP